MSYKFVRENVFVNDGKKQEYKLVPVRIVHESLSSNTGRSYFNNETETDQDILNSERQLIGEKYEEFRNSMVFSIKENGVESGVIYDYEELFNEYYVENPYISIKLLEKLLREYYDKKNVVKAILHIISHYPYVEVGEELTLLMAALLNHADKGVRKFALKIFDNWDAVETLPVLKGTQEMKEKWLNVFKEKIIERLERKESDAIFITSDQSRKLA